MFWMRSDGGGTPQPVFGNSDHVQFPFSFTSDRMAYFEEYDARKYHLWTVAVKSDAEGLHFSSPEPFYHTPGADERHPAFSPDGRWLAYAAGTGDTQTREIYVRAFPGTPLSGRWQVSKNGGLYPMWSRNGRQLFFRTDDNQVMVADCEVKGDTFASFNLRAWSDTRLADIGPQANYDVAPDGNRILGVLPVVPSGQSASHHVIFLLNFFDELRRRVPVSSNR
jgi:serine/threonine-protein kinase